MYGRIKFGISNGDGGSTTSVLRQLKWIKQKSKNDQIELLLNKINLKSYTLRIKTRLIRNRLEKTGQNAFHVTFLEYEIQN